MALKDISKMIARAKENVPPAQQFLQMLNEATIRLDKPRKPSQTYKPSSLGGCKRMVYFQVVGAEPDPDAKRSAENIGITEHGTDRHLRIQTVVTQMKDLNYPVEWVDVAEYVRSRPHLKTEVVEQAGLETKLFNPVLNLSFLCDGVIKLNNQYFVIEIKTEGNYKWMQRGRPADMAIVQATCYSVALGIDQVIYLYENRDTLMKKAYDLIVTDEMKYDKVVAVIEDVESHIQNETVPEKTTITSQCTYCSYKKECAKW